MKYTPSYTAEDGSVFDNRAACLEYEALKALETWYVGADITDAGTFASTAFDEAPALIALLKPFLPRKPRGPRKPKAATAKRARTKPGEVASSISF